MKHYNPKWLLDSPREIEGRTLIATTNVTSPVASVDFTGLKYDYTTYELEWLQVEVATDDDSLFITLSTDNGDTWLGGTNYCWTLLTTEPGSGPTRSGSTGGAAIVTNSSSGGLGLSSTAGEGYCGRAILTNLELTNHLTMIRFNGVYVPSAAVTNPVISDGGGYDQTARAHNGVRFICSTGNIQAGVFNVYGIR